MIRMTFRTDTQFPQQALREFAVTFEKGRASNIEPVV